MPRSTRPWQAICAAAAPIRASAQPFTAPPAGRRKAGKRPETSQARTSNCDQERVVGFPAEAMLFRSQQDRVLVTASVSSIAEDLTGVVDSHGIRDGETGVGGNQSIQIDQRPAAHDEGDVLARPEWVVTPDREDRSTDDLA